ncbi:hypothetical protein F441_17633 [Phytophthora nicotianae CJ01A1]|uniref:SWIM-type domain-containing protein n=2 Tax=Phytophthora nicotianae TaxID=4792 RepID=W2W5L4_PHYNI|nr:hypothetical protein L914_17082 [Phytophthora nicotianae]ETP05860.1 hypothetical protein F441_17633 [Phytophthora nicotianae CJ01A1]
MASTPKGLTDEEKAVASMFYRSAVKWSVRRAHHVGMSQEGWLVRINIFQCKCPYFRKFLFCAHVVCGRAAAGLSRWLSPEIQRSPRPPREPTTPYQAGQLPSIERAQQTLLVHISQDPPPPTNPWELHSDVELSLSSSFIFFSDIYDDCQDQDPTDRFDALPPLSHGLEQTQAALSAEGSSSIHPAYVPMTNSQIGVPLSLPGKAMCPLSPGTHTVDPHTYITALPTELLPFRAQRGRPPLASPALDIQYILG